MLFALAIKKLLQESQPREKKESALEIHLIFDESLKVSLLLLFFLQKGIKLIPVRRKVGNKSRMENFSLSLSSIVRMKVQAEMFSSKSDLNLVTVHQIIAKLNIVL